MMQYTINQTSIAKEFPWLTNIDFYVTTACNMIHDCKDCMAYDIIQEEGIKHMEKELFFHVMSYLDGIDSVHIAGAREPFSHPDIFELLDYASKKVKKEVRVNTNGRVIPNAYEENCNDKEVKEFFENIPKKTHFYLSFDGYHDDGMGEDDLFGRVCTLLEYSNLYGFDVTFSIRVIDKNSIEPHKFIIKYSDKICTKISPWSRAKELNDKYYKTVYKGVVNRVLKMGKAKDIEGARYIDLTKLLDNHINHPMIGIRYDETVVSNFIPTYMPKSNRLSLCELGDLKTESLLKILKRYDRERYSLHHRRESCLRSLIDDMKSHPFIIENPHQFNWNHPDLKEKKEEIIENTLDLLLQELDKFLKPIYAGNLRLKSNNSNLRYDVKFSLVKKGDIRHVKKHYDILFKPQKIKIGETIITQKKATEDKILKLCLFFDNLYWWTFWHGFHQKRSLLTEIIDKPGGMEIIDNLPQFWINVMRKIGLPEEEWKIYLVNLIRKGFSTGLYRNLFPHLGIKSNAPTLISDLEAIDQTYQLIK